MDDLADAADGRSGTFLVKSADETAVVLQDVETAQVHTVAAMDVEAALETAGIDPGGDAAAVEVGTVFEETTIAPAADGVRWTVETLGEARRIPVDRVELEPTKRSREAARELAPGELATYERAGEGSIHVLAVSQERLDGTASDILDDSATQRRAARLGVDRVEIRTGTTGNESTEEQTAGSEETRGVVSVRYVPT
jgi:hypothetical protein